MASGSRLPKMLRIVRPVSRWHGTHTRSGLRSTVTSTRIESTLAQIGNSATPLSDVFIPFCTWRATTLDVTDLTIHTYTCTALPAFRDHGFVILSREPAIKQRRHAPILLEVLANGDKRSSPLQPRQENAI